MELSIALLAPEHPNVAAREAGGEAYFDCRRENTPETIVSAFGMTGSAIPVIESSVSM